jgi:hypothetical protein
LANGHSHHSQGHRPWTTQASNKYELLTLRSLDQAVIWDADVMTRLLKIYSDGALSKAIRNEALYLILCRMSQSPRQLKEPVSIALLSEWFTGLEGRHILCRGP